MAGEQPPGPAYISRQPRACLCAALTLQVLVFLTIPEGLYKQEVCMPKTSTAHKTSCQLTPGIRKRNRYEPFLDRGKGRHVGRTRSQRGPTRSSESKRKENPLCDLKQSSDDQLIRPFSWEHTKCSYRHTHIDHQIGMILEYIPYYIVICMSLILCLARQFILYFRWYKKC